MSTPWSETLFPYGAPVGVAPASAISNDLQINKNNPGVQFLGTEANAVFSEEREIAGDLWFVTNATYASTGTPGQWAQSNAAAASYALVLRAAGQVQRLTAPAASPNPVVWTTVSSTDALGNVTLSAGTLTSPSLVPLAVTATWNAAGQAMTAARVNVTDTASASNSLLLDLQVGGVSKFSVRKDGTLTGVGFIDTTATAQTKLGPLTVGPAPTNAVSVTAEIIAQGRFRSITATGTTTQSTGAIQLGDPAYLSATLDWQESVTGAFALRRNDSGNYVPIYVGGVTLQSGVFTGSGAGLTTGTVPNAALVTTPVTSVTAGSSKISIGGTAGAPTVDVVPANFSGIPWTALPYQPVQSVAAGSSKVTLGGTAIAPTVDVNPANFAAGSIANTVLATTPIDVSSTAQTKAGALTAATFTSTGVPVTVSAGQVGFGNDTTNSVFRSGTGAYYFQNADGSAQVALNALRFNGSGAGITSGTLPNAALVTAPVTSVTAASTKITIAGTATAPTVDVVPGNFAAGTVPNAALVTAPVTSVAAGSSKVTVGGTATAPTVDVNPANFAAGTVPNASLVTTPLDVSSTGQTKAGYLATGANAYTATVSAGDATHSSTASAGRIWLGGTAIAKTLDFGVTTANVFAFNSPLQVPSAPANAVAYVPPVYTAAGATLASTTHIVSGTAAIPSGSSVTITLTGAAVFTSTSSYSVLVSPANSSSTGTVYATRVSGSSFTITGVTAGTYDYIAIGA